MLITAARPQPVSRPKVQFPTDEGAHPEAKTEWWYLHGYLEDEEGKSYGFHHALFDAPDVINGRYNVDLPAMPGAMALDAALTEETDGQHTRSRQMTILPPFLRHPGLKENELDVSYRGPEGNFRMRRWDSETIKVSGIAGRGQLDLEMKQTKPVLLMGGEGEIKMGPKGLSKYYSIPRMQVQGTLLLDGEEKAVKGSAWLDHQWGDMAIFDGYKGWDWFGIQLDNRTEINAFHFRAGDGGTVQASVGILNPDGSQTVTEDLRLTPGRTFKSEETGAEYPIEWRLSLPQQQIELELKPSLDAQEMVGHPPFSYPELGPKPTYWEGSMHVTGTIAGQPVQGRAYTELVGYPGDRLAVSQLTPETIELAQKLAAEHSS